MPGNKLYPGIDPVTKQPGGLVCLYGHSWSIRHSRYAVNRDCVYQGSTMWEKYTGFEVVIPINGAVAYPGTGRGTVGVVPSNSSIGRFSSNSARNFHRVARGLPMYFKTVSDNMKKTQGSIIEDYIPPGSSTDKARICAAWCLSEPKCDAFAYKVASNALLNCHRY